MATQLIECVPNFSEGQRPEVIQQICEAIRGVAGVVLLHSDSGFAANRTVISFIGQPDAVVDAAFRAIQAASMLIDMRLQKGTHPRFGSTDVCPLVPFRNISMRETVVYAHKLAKRVGDGLGIPVFCYEYAASTDLRKNLANCRQGQYEGLSQKLSVKEWKPDYGPAEFVPKTGAVAIGARKLLVAYNINLNTTSVNLAKILAACLRESGNTGLIHTVLQPRRLQSVKAIGWFLEDFGIAQVSMNLTDIEQTPIHEVFDVACALALELGLRITGSEIVGLVPKQALLDAGAYFLRKQGDIEIKTETELLTIAIKTLGLSELSVFDPAKKIIEIVMNE